MKYLKRFESLNDEITVANIRYADDEKELKPLSEEGIDYVLRHGDTKKAYYKLNYSDMKEYGYAPLGEEVPEEFFQNKKINYINSIYM
jgi:hypothetical protein